MWNKLKRSYRQFQKDEPGERFLNTYERSREHSKGPLATILIIVAGAVLIVGGFLLGLIPGVPGIVLGLVGFALIATRSRRIAIGLDWTEVKVRSIGKRCRRVMAHR